jgi:hypothetical protein
MAQAPSIRVWAWSQYYDGVGKGDRVPQIHDDWEEDDVDASYVLIIVCLCIHDCFFFV